MQKRVLLGAAAIILVVVGVVAVRGVQHVSRQAADQTIDRLLANLPPGYSITHGAVGYDPLTGVATLHDVALSRDTGVKWTAETVTVGIADARALQDVFDPSAYPNGQPAWADRRLLLNDAAATNVRATVPQASAQPGSQPGTLQYTIAHVSLHRLSGRPFALPPTPENRRTAAFQRDAALALAVDSLRETDTAVELPGPSPSKLTLGTLTASNYDGGRLGSLLLKDLAADSQQTRGGPVHATLASVSVKDADLRPMLRPPAGAGAEMQPSAMSAVYSSADADGLAIGGGRVAVQWKELHGEMTAPDTAGVRAGSGYLHGLTVGTGSDPVPADLARSLDAFGMRSVTADIDAKTHGTRGGATEIGEVVALHGLGTLHLTGAYTVVQQSSPTLPPLMGLMRTTLQHLELQWDDASLVDRIFKLAAAQSHTTPELLRGQLAMPVLALGAMLPDQPDAVDQLSAFLEHPHMLRITMAPQPPVSLAEVARAPVTARAHLLGVHITGN